MFFLHLFAVVDFNVVKLLCLLQFVIDVHCLNNVIHKCIKIVNTAIVLRFAITEPDGYVAQH